MTPKTGQLIVFGFSKSVMACMAHIDAIDLHQITIIGEKAQYFSDYYKRQLRNIAPNLQVNEIEDG